MVMEVLSWPGRSEEMKNWSAADLVPMAEPYSDPRHLGAVDYGPFVDPHG